MLDFSVVVPTYNRPASLKTLLEALSQQEYPREGFEVIVVDDGGDGACGPIVQEYENRLNITHLVQENAGPGAARNLGAKQAAGQYLAFTDDDCIPAADWLRILSGGLAGSPDAICGGRTINRLKTNLYCEATQLLLDYLYENYSPESVPGGFFTANNLAINRETFLKTGGFTAALRFGEDREFCYRCSLQGYKFVHAPQAVVEHAHDVSLASFLKLHFNYGNGTYQFRRDCYSKGFPSVAISPLSWYLKLVASGVNSSPTLRGLLLTVLLGLMQTASAAGYLWGVVKPESTPEITQPK